MYVRIDLEESSPSDSDNCIHVYTNLLSSYSFLFLNSDCLVKLDDLAEARLTSGVFLNSFRWSLLCVTTHSNCTHMKISPCDCDRDLIDGFDASEFQTRDHLWLLSSDYFHCLLE